MANRKPATATVPAVSFEIGGTATSAPASETLEQKVARLEAENAAIKGQLSGGTSTRVQPTYPEPKTPRGVADAVLAMANSNVWTPLPGSEALAKLRTYMILRVPGTVSEKYPLGEPVMEVNKGNNKQYRVKPNLDRGDYINLGKLSKQLSGNVQENRHPEPLTEDQINRVLRPILDNLTEAAIFKFSQK